MLREHDLTYVIRDEVMIITTIESAEKKFGSANVPFEYTNGRRIKGNHCSPTEDCHAKFLGRTRWTGVGCIRFGQRIGGRGNRFSARKSAGLPGQNRRCVIAAVVPLNRLTKHTRVIDLIKDPVQPGGLTTSTTIIERHFDNYQLRRVLGIEANVFGCQIT